MTRFMEEITGVHGDFWKRDAERKVADMVERYNTGFLRIDENGVATWASNGNTIPNDLIEVALYAGIPVNEEATKEESRRQCAETVRRYKESQARKEYSAEELYEMRAAFGEGTTVVDVITGRKITL